MPLVSAPSLTLLTAHKHFYQFEILEALRLPKDVNVNVVSKRDIVLPDVYIDITVFIAQTKHGKLNILKSIPMFFLYALLPSQE